LVDVLEALEFRDQGEARVRSNPRKGEDDPGLRRFLSEVGQERCDRCEGAASMHLLLEYGAVSRTSAGVETDVTAEGALVRV
jgi:hypothetical protein